MEPLSLIRQFVPGVERLPLPKSVEDAQAGQAIPLKELQKLSPAGPISLDPNAGLAAVGGNGDSFSNLLKGFVHEVDGQQTAAKDAVNGLLTGKNVSLHQAMIAMEEANVSFQLMVEVRNKLLDSYQELMRMQV